MWENDLFIYVKGDALVMVLEVEGHDFTGKQVKSMFKRTKNQVSADMLFQSSDGSIVIDVISTTKATLTFVKTVTQMNALDLGIYNYDVQVFTNADDVYTFCKGKVKIVNELTT